MSGCGLLTGCHLAFVLVCQLVPCSTRKRVLTVSIVWARKSSSEPKTTNFCSKQASFRHIKWSALYDQLRLGKWLLDLLEVYFQFGVVLEAVHQQSSTHDFGYLLHVSLSEILAHKAFIVLAPHMHK